MFESYFEMLTPVTIGILAGIFALIGLFVWLKRSANKKSASPDIVTATTPAIDELKKVNGYKCKCGQQFPELKEIRTHVLVGRKEKGKHGFAGRIEIAQPGAQVATKSISTKQPSILGTGKYKCMGIRQETAYGQALDFTTIPDRIGEAYMAETSTPASGGTYTVLELSDGQVVDYDDPRAVAVNIEETPEYAFFATHWDIVKQVFAVPLHWWQSMNNWWVAAILIIDFVAVLVFFGG